MSCTDNTPEVAFDQGDSGTFHGDVSAGAHGYSYLGLRQSGCIVDAVTGHGNNLPLFLQALDLFHLPLRKHFCNHFIEIEFPCYGLSRGATVSRDHDDTDAFLVKLLDRLKGCLFYRVGDTDKTNHLFVQGYKHDRLTVSTHCFSFDFQLTRINMEIFHEMLIAKGYSMTFHFASDALTGNGFERINFLEVNSPFFRPRYNG